MEDYFLNEQPVLSNQASASLLVTRVSLIGHDRRGEPGSLLAVTGGIDAVVSLRRLWLMQRINTRTECNASTSMSCSGNSLKTEN